MLDYPGQLFGIGTGDRETRWYSPVFGTGRTAEFVGNEVYMSLRHHSPGWAHTRSVRGRTMRMKAKVQVYAIVRIDGPIESAKDANDRVAITRVLPDFEEAASEVERLNKLNSDKGCFYLWRTTRYFPEENSK